MKLIALSILILLFYASRNLYLNYVSFVISGQNPPTIVTDAASGIFLFSRYKIILGTIRSLDCDTTRNY